jgi:predicted transcriptional regulator
MTDIDQIAEYCKCSSARALDLLEALSLRTLVESSDKARNSLWQFATPIRQKYLFIQAEIDNRDFVLQLLRLNPESGLPISLIMEKCGMPRSSVKRFLGQLKSEGLVQIIGKGAGSRWSCVNTQQR